MRIGLVFDQEVHIGGGFQQELSTVKSLYAHQGQPHEFVTITTHKSNVKVLAELGIEAHYCKLSKLRNLVCLATRGPLMGQLFLKRFTGSSRTPFERSLDRYELDLVYFLSASLLSSFVHDLPVMLRVFDLCHRDWPEFPEVRVNRELDLRDDLLRRVCPRAIAILVDGELSVKRLASRYGVDEHRVHVLPFEPGDLPAGSQASGEEIKAMRLEVGLGDEPFVFYPAQYWPHKNHAYILRAIKRLADEGVRIHAVFCGSDKGNRPHIQKQAADLGIGELIHPLGFIDRSMLASLYREAVALVMPTWFGPTNIPPLEAFASGCPVIYSDLPGLGDQVGDAALLMALDDPNSLATHLKRLIEEPQLREQLIARGEARLKELQQADPWCVHQRIFEQYELCRSSVHA